MTYRERMKLEEMQHATDTSLWKEVKAIVYYAVSWKIIALAESYHASHPLEELVTEIFDEVSSACEVCVKDGG